MSFLSGIFFIFLFVTAALYYLAPLKWRWLVLLLASIVFYLSWGWETAPVVLVSALLVYLAAIRIENIYERQDEQLKAEPMDAAQKRERKLRAKKRCRTLLTATGVVLILILVYCKVGEVLLDGMARLTGTPLPGWLQVLAPLGVSYYTFSMLSYLADVYWRKDKVERNFLKLLLFMLFFPKILQGPISRHKDLGAQIAEGHAFDYRQFTFGAQLALWGYFKKLVIADRLSIFVTTVFANSYEEKSSLIFVVAAMLGSLQLYCDFSGCMDMARGFCQMLGIDLEKNFDHPFFSKSAAEFWRRWHITLGTWFKDYVYMPMVISPTMMKLAQKVKKAFGAKAAKNIMTIIPLSCVWLLTGLWHGTGPNYIAWGIYWGVLIICGTLFAPQYKKMTSLLKINTEAKSWQVFQMARTFLLFSFGRLLTLPGHLRTTWDILKQTVQKFDIWILFDGSLYQYGLNEKNFRMAMFGVFVLWCVSMLQRKGSVREMIAKNNAVIRWLIYYAAFFAVIIFGVWGAGYDSVGFTYMNY